jgi:capsular polysaccharide biosynthesis protein
VDDADQTVSIRRLSDADLASGSWADHRFGDPEPADGPGAGSADAAAGLASLSFITDAIRRRARLWVPLALAGMLLGGALYMLHPPLYQATTKVLLTLGPNEDPQSAINTDAAIAESRPVAAIALQQLGDRESVDSLLSSYTAVPLTNLVFTITVNQESKTRAVSQAAALAQAFLQYRTGQLRAYEKLVLGLLSRQVVQAKARIQSINDQITSLSAQISSPEQTAQLTTLQTQLSRAKDALGTTEDSVRTSRQETQLTTDAAVKRSLVIDAATLASHSRLRLMVLYPFAGLIVGLALGLGYVSINALISERLRRRSDIAYALGAPVSLSMGRLRHGRGLSGVSHPDIQRITRHLLNGLTSEPTAALAVVPADRPDVAALTVVALALSCAKQDMRVVVADLCPGSPAARLLGTNAPGVHEVKVQDTSLVVVVPGRDDPVPVGPVKSEIPPPGSAAPEVAAAYSSAEVLLTLVALDPMLGSEHLATWATYAAVMVTAGRSSWTRVQAVGEMIRLAGVHVGSVVLVGADKADESLGMTYPANSRGW